MKQVGTLKLINASRGQTLQARMDVSRHPGQQCMAIVCSTLILGLSDQCVVLSEF